MFQRLGFVYLLISSMAAVAAEVEVDALYNTARRQLDEGDYRGAADSLHSVWQRFAEHLGESAPDTIHVRIFHGQVLTMMGESQKALDVLGPISSGNDRASMVARASFAVALRQAGMLKRANTILRGLLPVFPSATREDHIHRSRIHSELAVCLAFQGRAREAEDHATRALRLLDEAGNPAPPNRTAILLVLGQIHLIAGHDGEARAVLEQAQRASQPFWRSNHPEYAILHGALGVLAMRARHWDEAESHFRTAVTSLETLLGPEHREVGIIDRQLAIILKHQKRKQEAREFGAKAERILGRAPNQVSSWSWRKLEQ